MWDQAKAHVSGDPPGVTLDMRSEVGRNTVTSGGPVTVIVTGPIPCYRSRVGLSSMCLASGNQRRSCSRSRERDSVTVPKTKLRPALMRSVSGGHLRQFRNHATRMFFCIYENIWLRAGMEG